MRRFSLTFVVHALLSLAACGDRAFAVSPQNPYRSFNLSGINYGSMQWERAQREGRRVWPYYNTPTPASRSVPTVVVGGFGAGGGMVGTAAPQPRRVFRRWRR